MNPLIVGLLIFSGFPRGLVEACLLKPCPADIADLQKAYLQESVIQQEKQEIVAIQGPNYEWLVPEKSLSCVQTSNSSIIYIKSVGRLFPYMYPRKWVDPPV